MRFSFRRSFEWLSLVLVLGVIGCQPADRLAEDTRSKILSSLQPATAASLASTYDELSEGSEVTVVGRIYATGMDAFEKSTAAFNLIELPEPGHNHDDPGDCPFCKRKLENAATAIVQIVDDAGEILNEPANELLGLEKNQDVVVTGTASKVGDLMIITASSIHTLSETAATEFAKQVAAEFNVSGMSSEEVLDAIPEPPPLPGTSLTSSDSGDAEDANLSAPEQEGEASNVGAEAGADVDSSSEASEA